VIKEKLIMVHVLLGQPTVGYGFGLFGLTLMVLAVVVLSSLYADRDKGNIHDGIEVSSEESRKEEAQTWFWLLGWSLILAFLGLVWLAPSILYLVIVIIKGLKKTHEYAYSPAENDQRPTKPN
jgi:hypothetical protein